MSQPTPTERLRRHIAEFCKSYLGDRVMNNLAENLETIVEAESNRYDQLDCEIVEFSPEHRESLSENFLEELDAWARHSLASNGFGDYCAGSNELIRQ
jgi:hypothetical protein